MDTKVLRGKLQEGEKPRRRRENFNYVRDGDYNATLPFLVTGNRIQQWVPYHLPLGFGIHIIYVCAESSILEHCYDSLMNLKVTSLSWILVLVNFLSTYDCYCFWNCLVCCHHRDGARSGSHIYILRYCNDLR